jgi:nitronate monooxygenase
MARANEAVKRLGIEHPIVQGPFGGGLSTIKLAALVAERGGLGSFGAHATAPDQIGRLVGDIRHQTNRPFAINLWVIDHDPGALDITAEEFERIYARFEPYFRELGVPKPDRPTRYGQPFAEQMDALLEARPPIASFIFGLPEPKILAECRRRGILTIATVTSIAEAEMADGAGVDVIVATGSEAGGHRPSFLASAEDSLMGTFALTQLVADRVKAPVVAAGGITDARGIRAVLALGGQAAQIGTAFLACAESGATDEHRAILFSERARATTLTRAFTGRLARGVRNRWTDEIAPAQGQIAPYPVQSWFLSQLRPAAVAAKRTDLVSLWGGQMAPNVRHRRAADLMSDLIAGLG